ncbi:MAG: hypothetical protein ACYDDO_13530 [Acidiferrobacterales bacterium]
MIKAKKLMMIAVLTALFMGITAPQAYAYETGDDGSVLLDLFVLRPMGLFATVAGTIIFVGSLPISIPTWSVRRTFHELVQRPATYTFYRNIGDEN